MYTSVPTERDTDKPTLELAIARTFGTAILVEGSGPQNLLRDVPSERMAARARAAETVNSEISRMARRIIFVGNGLYPSTENATLHGMTPAEFSTMFWSGVNVDPATIAATAVPVKAALAAGTMRITTAAGTDITFTLSGGHVFVSDGAISKDDMAAGPGGGNTWLPAGEVYTRIAPGSANGTIVAERFVLEGEEVTNLRLEVVNGKVTAITAASPIERLLARYDAATAGKDALTVVDIGVNPGMVIPEGSKFQSYMPSGMVTLFTGIDTWAGGSNNSSMGLTLFLSGATVTVNGTPIVADGVLTEWSKM
jgi:leucyl aminopeptidase (aminopeptidase T)